MKTFVGLLFTLITSGGLSLLVYLTFRSGGSVDPSRRAGTKRAPEAAAEGGEESTTGPLQPPQATQPGRTDEGRTPDKAAS